MGAPNPPPRATILMVDDRAENLVALEAVLGPLGHTLVRANSGREALREVLQHDFAVILMDVQMPEMNGFETVQMIKARPRSRDVPIIFLTAISKDEGYVFEGYSAGAVDYIFKPFNPDILRSKVTVFVDLFLKQREIEWQGALLQAAQRREMELRHRADMLEVEARHSQIVECAMDPIVSFGDDGMIRIFNAAAERTFGITEAKAIGQPIETLLPGVVASLSLPAAVPGNARSGASSDPTIHEAQAIRGDGVELPVEFTISTLVLEREREHTIILRDVSERKRAEALIQARTESLGRALDEVRAVNDQLAEQSSDLERAMGARNRFYANMSHELRTPINAILGYSSLLLEGIFGDISADQRNSVERTVLAAQHLLELVNDILDLSKVEAGKMDLKVEPVVFPDLIEELLATVTPLAEQHGVKLILDACRDQVMSDPRRVRQIMLNLLSNAIKFGDGKPVRVTCRRNREGALVLEVHDRGPGIARDDQERIFEEFVQLENQQAPGTGLGLPISRRLAELLGGTLTVTSRLGQGSVFHLTLPADGVKHVSEPASEVAEWGLA